MDFYWSFHIEFQKGEETWLHFQLEKVHFSHTKSAEKNSNFFTHTLRGVQKLSKNQAKDFKVPKILEK